MSSTNFTPPSPHIWVVKMKTYLQAYDLWEVANTDVELPPLRVNLTIAQIRQHSDDCAKKFKAMSCLQNGVFDVIFYEDHDL